MGKGGIAFEYDRPNEDQSTSLEALELLMHKLYLIRNIVSIVTISFLIIELF